MNAKIILNEGLKKFQRLQFELLGFTCPIFIRERTSFCLVGSSCLIKNLNRSYIVTATHVADAIQNKEYFILGKDNAPYKISFNFICAINKKDQYDTVDSCFAEISDNDSKILEQRWRFWDISNSADRVKISQDVAYSLIGYPASKNVFRSNINPIAYVLTKSKANLDIYKKYNYDPKYNIMIEFDPEDCVYLNDINDINIDQLVTFPKANGISGCPLWYTLDFQNVDSFVTKPILIGIIKEQTNDKKYLIAAKSEIACHGIRNMKL